MMTATALGQDAADGIEKCAAAPSDAERIACLEALIRNAGGTADAARVAPDEPPDAPAVVTESPPAVATEAAGPPEVAHGADATPTPMPAAEAAGVEEPLPAQEVPEPAASAVAAPATSAPGSNVEQESGRTVGSLDRAAAELGAEQVAVRESRDDETLVVQAMVISHREVGYQKLRVELDNGQIWQQTNGDRQRVLRKLRNSPQFDVELWGTKTGGYRMHIPSQNLTIRVERLQ